MTETAILNILSCYLKSFLDVTFLIYIFTKFSVLMLLAMWLYFMFLLILCYKLSHVILSAATTSCYVKEYY